MFGVFKSINLNAPELDVTEDEVEEDRDLGDSDHDEEA
jgi:hypothetical protein